MPLTPRQVLAAAATLLASTILASAPAWSRNHWQINQPSVSTEVTGTAASPLSVRDVPSAEEQMPPGLAQAPGGEPDAADAAPPEVDLSALRYFARQGDRRRLEIEIARLGALYPQWTPPADPLAVPVNVDERLEAMWRLYSEGRLAEARQAIARRRSDDPDWQAPADLLDRLALAEARERLVNASQIDQHEAVIRIASENPHLLTCGEVDVLWRVAEAFARTDRQARARDAYRYILTSCDDPQERLATMQNASRSLDQPLVDELLALERVDASGAGEFAPVRDDLARDAVSRGGEDATAVVAAEDLGRVERLAAEGGAAADARLLGWYYLQRQNNAEAENWFRRAREAEDSGDASRGLALALMARGQHAEAEGVAYPWRGEGEEARRVHLAAAANLLGVEPRPVLSDEVLGRIVAEAAAGRDVPTARQLGWYARAWQQHQTAGQWFTTALGWDPDDEPSAYGLALTRHLLGDAAGLSEIKRIWRGRSERIRQVGLAVTEPAPAPTAAPRSSAPQAPVRPDAASGATPSASAGRQTCAVHVDPQRLSAEAALQRGWCLMDADRPMEALRAFEAAFRSGSDRVRRDAAWGQSLAYLRVELVDDAAVAAVSAPQDARRARELQTAILAQRAAGAFRQGRYVETLMALDQRAGIAPERLDLMVLRGYAYFRLNRLHDAERVFKAVAATGDREGIKGLAAVQQMSQQMR